MLTFWFRKLEVLLFIVKDHIGQNFPESEWLSAITFSVSRPTAETTKRDVSIYREQGVIFPYAWFSYTVGLAEVTVRTF